MELLRPVLKPGTVAPGFVQFVPTSDIGNDQEFTFEGEAELLATKNRDRITIRAMEKDRFERWRTLTAGAKPFLGS